MGGLANLFDPLDILGGRAKKQEEQNRRVLRDFDSVDGFKRIADDNGNLRSNFSSINAGAGDINSARSGLNRLQGLTNFQEGTPIAQRLLEVQNTANTQAVNNIAAQQAGQLAQGVGALARQGGVSSGARERLASNAFNQGLLARQRQGASDQATRQQIGADDAQRQLSILQNLPGQFQNLAQFQQQARQFDIGNAIKDIRASNEADQQRQATRAQLVQNQQNAPKGGLLGTVGGILGGIFG
jgi:hypothetical protein